MQNIPNLVMQAFATRSDLIEAAIIAIICALLMGRFAFVIVWALIALIVDSFLPIVYGIIQTGNVAGVSANFQTVIHGLEANWTLVGIKYVVYLIVIAILFLLKSLLFRRS